MRQKKQYPVWDNYRYAFYYLRKKEGAGALAVCVFDAVCSILLPFLEAALAGAVAACLVSERKPEEILMLILGYVVLLQGVRFLQSHLRVLRDSHLMLFRGRMGMEYFRKTLEMDGQSLESSTGQGKKAAASRNIFTGNSLGIEAYVKSFCDMAISFGGLAAYSVIIGRKSLLLLLLLILQTFLAAVLHTLAGRRAYAMEDEIEKHWKGFRYLRRESIQPQSGKDIRIYRMDRWFLRTLHGMIDRIVKLIDKQEKGYMAAGILEKLLSFGRNILIYGYLLWEMSKGRLSLASFLLYIGIVAGFGAWMSGLFDSLQQIWQNEKLMDSYRGFMDYGTVQDNGKEKPSRAGGLHEIRLENVSFRYEGSEEDTIHNMNLTIRPGDKLALVGLNGAGKTTLIKLICGFYRPTSGKVFLDGQDMAGLSQKDIFREFSVVFQDVFAFSFPLAENVSCCGAGREDGRRLEESLEAAGLLEKVRELPDGAGTYMNKDLDENGVTFSGGELQKLMLARALYKDAPVVILDEPTAALDPIAESGMYERYDEMIQGRTSIFISHRLSSTRFCDRILFMEKGRIIEEGNHENLMEKGGAYAELFALQARYYQKKRQEEESYA